MPVRPGDPLRIKADEYNAAVEAGKAFRTLSFPTRSEQRGDAYPGAWRVWIRKGLLNADAVEPGEFLSWDATRSPQGFQAADRKENAPWQVSTDGPIYVADTPYDQGGGQFGYNWRAHGIAPQYFEQTTSGTVDGVLLIEGLLWVWATIHSNVHSYVRPMSHPRVMETCDTHGHLIRWKPIFDSNVQLPQDSWVLTEVRTRPVCPVLFGRATNNMFPGQGETVTLLDGTDVYGVQYEHITGSGRIDAGVNVAIQFWPWKQDFYVVDADCNPS